MKISEIKPGQGKIDVAGEVSEKGEPRTFNKFGREGKVANAKLTDESGSMKLTLWNEQVDLLNDGDKIKITNGYASEYQGETQLSTGKFGNLEVVSAGTAPKKSAKPSSAEPSKKKEEESEEEFESTEEETFEED